MKKENQTTAERLIYIRKQLKMDQTKFSAESGVSYSAVTKIESGAIQVSEKVLKKIADRFGEDVANWISTGIGEVEIQPEREAVDPSMMVQHVEFLQQQLALMSAIIAKLTGVSKPGKVSHLDLAGMFKVENNQSRVGV